jgi:hypothetical protein
MTPEEIKEFLDRVLTWSPQRQRTAAYTLLDLEAEFEGVYRPTAEEGAAIREGSNQVERGEVVSDGEMAGLWRKFGLDE